MDWIGLQIFQQVSDLTAQKFRVKYNVKNKKIVTNKNLLCYRRFAKEISKPFVIKSVD